MLYVIKFDVTSFRGMTLLEHVLILVWALTCALDCQSVLTIAAHAQPLESSRSCWWSVFRDWKRESYTDTWKSFDRSYLPAHTSSLSSTGKWTQMLPLIDLSSKDILIYSQYPRGKWETMQGINSPLREPKLKIMQRTSYCQYLCL